MATIFAAAMTLLCCCSRGESVAAQPESDAETEMLNLEITLNLAEPSAASSRAVEDGGLDYDTSMQRLISPQDIYLIFYNPDGTIALVPDLTPLLGAVDAPVRTLRTRLPLAGRSLSFRVLANVASASSIGSTPAEVRSSLREVAAEGYTDADLCKLIFADAFSEQGIWPLSTEAGYLPMHSAMSEVIEFSHDIVLNTVLYRSLAKIGVEYVEPDPPFVIDQVRVVNQHRRGSLISPYMPSANMNVQFSQPFVRDPELRGENTVFNLASGVNSLFEQIFVPEHINTGNPDNDLYLMIGGHFLDGVKTYWYNIYFTDNGHLPVSDENSSYDVIRNYSYIFRINKITVPLIEIELVVNPGWAEVHDLSLEE